MRILGLLKSTLWHTDVRTRLIAYKTLCRSLLVYASDAWNPHLEKYIYAFKMVQNRAVRLSLVWREWSVWVVRENSLACRRSRREGKIQDWIHTLMKVLDYEHLRSVLINYIDNLNTSCDSCQTRNSTRGAPKAQTKSKNQFLYSFMSRTMRDLRE